VEKEYLQVKLTIEHLVQIQLETESFDERMTAHTCQTAQAFAPSSTSC
jgi:hypothetical protein